MGNYILAKISFFFFFEGKWENHLFSQKLEDFLELWGEMVRKTS